MKETDTDVLCLCIWKNPHHFNLYTESNKRFCPGCSHTCPEVQVRSTPCWSATSHTIVDHFLVVPWLSRSISAPGSTRDLCWHVPGGGDPAFVMQQCGVKWIHAAARHGALGGACRGRRASDAPLLLAWSMITPQMPVTPAFPFTAPSWHWIPKACFYLHHKPLTEHNVFTPSIVCGVCGCPERNI